MQPSAIKIMLDAWHTMFSNCSLFSKQLFSPRWTSFKSKL